MYLVPTDHHHRGTRLRPSPRERKKRSRLKQEPNPYEMWFNMRNKIRKADITRKTRTKAMSDFLERVMPDTTTGSCLAAPFLQSQIWGKKIWLSLKSSRKQRDASIPHRFFDVERDSIWDPWTRIYSRWWWRQGGGILRRRRKFRIRSQSPEEQQTLSRYTIRYP